MAQKQELVGLVQGLLLFLYTIDRGNVVAAHVEKKSGDGGTSRGTKTRPLIIGELLPVTLCTYSNRNGMHSLFWMLGERSGVIITRGSSNGGLWPDDSNGSTVFTVDAERFGR